MKKLLTKMLALALIAAMSIGLVACGSSDDGSSSSSGSSDSSTEDGVVTIAVYRDTFNLASPDSKEVEAVANEINKYLESKGAKVRITLTDVGSGEFKDKAQLALKNNEINLLWTASWMELVGCDDLIKDNSAYDLTSLLPGTTLYTSIPEWVWDASSYDGKNYFISCYKESAEGYDLMFRKDLVDKYGWDVSTVKTLKDVEPMLVDCLSEGLKYPYLTQKTGMFHRYYLNNFDFFSQDSFIGVDRETNEVVNTVLSDEYLEFTTLMAEWHEKGYLSEDDATKQTTDTTTQTQDWGISWWTDVPNNLEANTRYKQEVVMAPVTDRWSHSTTTLGSCFAVTSNSTEEQAKACIEFLGLLYTDKTLADLYTFGIEGTDYDVVDGKIKKKGDMYNHSAWESCSVLCLSLEEGEPDNKVDLYKAFNDGSKSSCASGFRFDNTPVAAEYTACQNVYQEYGFILENGGFAAADVATAIQDYAKALDDAGYQKVLEEAQKQYNEWKNK